MTKNQTITFPEQKTSPYKEIENLLNSANKLIEYNDAGLVFDSDKVNLFATLIHIERAVDSYRGLVFPGSGSQFSEDKSSIDRHLDELRSNIWSLRDSLDDDTVSESLEFFGEDFKRRFQKRT